MGRTRRVARQRLDVSQQGVHAVNKASIFAGQGAQVVGMGQDLAAADGAVMALFDQANEVLDFDLKQLCFAGPLEALTRSNVCQPAVFVVSIACLTAYQTRFPETCFTMTGGLSLGEWSALYAAGVLDFDTTVRVLEARGRFMQEACDEREGGMVSIMGATAEQLDALCRATGVTQANINSETQVVLSGAKADIAEAAKLAVEMKLKAVILAVAGAFHSPFMASARKKLTMFLKDVAFKTPQMPVLSNVSGKLHPAAGEEIKELMLRQVTEPVRLLDCVRTMRAAGIDEITEFGPGKVLSGLIKRIDRQCAVTNVQDAASLEALSRPNDGA